MLRSRPTLVFWAATLAQALLWFVVPAIFYSAPPDNLAQLLAVGHEFRFDAGVGPPLAYWLAEIAFRAAGLVGVYALAQLCVIATYYCVFALGRALVGAAHAAVAVLLMAGISLFTVPSPDFGPSILAMALWAIALLHFWRAVALKRTRSWYVFGVAGALLLLASSAALILLGGIILFAAATTRGRAALERLEPWIVALGARAVPVSASSLDSRARRCADAACSEAPRSASRNRQSRALAEASLRFVPCACRSHHSRRPGRRLATGADDVAPPLARRPIEPAAKTFVKLFALAPALLATIIAVIIGQTVPIGGAAPLLVLSGLGIVIAAGDSIALYHQRVLGFAWTGLLLVPALFVPLMIRAVAVDRGHRSASCAAGESHGPLLCREFRAAHRRAARRNHRRSAHRRIGRAHRAKPAERILR